MKFSYHPEAEQELLHSINYYENKTAGLMLLNRFPFGIIYSIQGEQIIIYAFMHLNRKPGYWRTRK